MPSNEERLNKFQLKALLKAMEGATLEIQRAFFEWLGAATKSGIRAQRASAARIAEIRQLYDDMIAIWSDYAEVQIPLQAQAAQRVMLEALRRRNAASVFFPKREISAIVADTKNKFISAAQGGFDRIETLMRRDPAEIAGLIRRSLSRGTESAWLRTTKQLNISETAVNEAVERGLRMAVDPRVVKTQINAALTNNLINGKVLVITTSGKDQYWNPASYSELVARTRGREAQTLASVETLREFGQDLIKISDHSTDTEICQQYEGKVYSLSGQTPGYDVAPDLPPFHPNCLHSILPYIDSEAQAAGPDRLETRSERDERVAAGINA